MTFIIAVFRGLLNFIYFFFKLFPLRNKVTLLSRQGNFAGDDFLMLAEEIKNQSPKTEVKILCKKLNKNPLGAVSYGVHILAQMFHIASSRAVVIDSYCIPVSILKHRKNLRIVQIWHALGALKKFGLSIVGEGEGSSQNIAVAMRMHRNYTYVLASGKACVLPYMEAFGCEENQIVVGSLPRVEMLLSDNARDESLKKIISRYPKIEAAKICDKKIIIYAPTFRKNIDVSNEVLSLIDAIKSDERIIIIKKHPLMKLNVNSSENIIVDEEFSTAEMLYAADVVITDYSAIVFEAALLEKALCFYAFDLDEYESKRSFYLNYRVDMPGDVCKAPGEVKDVLDKNLFDFEKIRAFAAAYIEETEHVTERLAEFVLNGKKK